MKYKDLVRELSELGYVLERSSGRHEIYVKEGAAPIAVPHHREINERTAKSILKKAKTGCPENGSPDACCDSDS